MPNETKTPKTITTNEAAKLAGVTPKTIRNWRSQGHFEWFPTTNENGCTRIHIDGETFMAYMKDRKGKPYPQAKSNIPDSPVNFEGRDSVVWDLFLQAQESRLAEKDARLAEKDAQLEEYRFVIKELREEIKVLKQYRQEYNALLGMGFWAKLMKKLEPVDETKLIDVQ